MIWASIGDDGRVMSGGRVARHSLSLGQNAMVVNGRADSGLLPSFSHCHVRRSGFVTG
jgi:hypothetical protein